MIVFLNIITTICKWHINCRLTPYRNRFFKLELALVVAENAADVEVVRVSGLHQEDGQRATNTQQSGQPHHVYRGHLAANL